MVYAFFFSFFFVGGGQWGCDEGQKVQARILEQHKIYFFFFPGEDSHLDSAAFIQTSLAGEGGNNTVCFLFLFFSIRSQTKFQDIPELRQSY